MLAIIGGDPLAFMPYVQLYHRTLTEKGKGPLPVGAHSPGHVAGTDEQAREELWPHYVAMHDRIGRERGWPPLTRTGFEQAAGPRGALCVGSPATVAAKIVRTAKGLGLSRFDLKYSASALPHDRMMRSIELYGKEVAPRVHEAMASPAGP